MLCKDQEVYYQTLILLTAYLALKLSQSVGTGMWHELICEDGK